MACWSSRACPRTASIISAAFKAPCPGTHPWFSSPVLPTILSYETFLTHFSISLRVWSIRAISRLLRILRWSPCFLGSRAYTICSQCAGRLPLRMHVLAAVKYAFRPALSSLLTSSSADTASCTLAPTDLYRAYDIRVSSNSSNVSSSCRSKPLSPSGALSSSNATEKCSSQTSNALSGTTSPSRYSSWASLPMFAASLRTPAGSCTKPWSGSSLNATAATFSCASHLPRSRSCATLTLRSRSSSASALATRSAKRAA